VEELEAIPDDHSAYTQDRERIQAAPVLMAAGDWYRFTYGLELLHSDWRDLLVAGGLGHEDWREVLDRELPRPS
jgi:hypothetical protein